MCFQFIPTHYCISRLSHDTNYKLPSIWSGVTHVLHIISLYSRWVVGDGAKINFWQDRWLNVPIFSKSHELADSLDSKVTCLI